MGEVVFVSAPARGKAVDAVFVPEYGAYRGTYLVEFEHGVIMEVRGNGDCVSSDLVGIDAYHIAERIFNIESSVEKRRYGLQRQAAADAYTRQRFHRHARGGW